MSPEGGVDGLPVDVGGGQGQDRGEQAVAGGAHVGVLRVDQDLVEEGRGLGDDVGGASVERLVRVENRPGKQAIDTTNVRPFP